MRFVLALSALPSALFGTSTAIACRDPTDRTAETIADLTYDTVVTAKVEQAAYTRKREPGWNVWEATVRVDHVLRGDTSIKMRQFKVSRYDGPGSCGSYDPLPAPGDTWVLYFEHMKDMPLQRRGSYPLETARWADPKLKRLLPPEARKKP